MAGCRATTRLLLICVLLAAPASGARERAAGFLQQRLELPGVPAAMLPADLTGDGRADLVVLVAYTGWTTRSEFAPAKFDDIEGLVEVMNVVDELVDRRELRLYPGEAAGAGFGDQLAALELDASVHALATGHPAEPLIAVTDDGAAAVRLANRSDGPILTLTPLIESATSFGGDGRFYPELELLHDLDSDGLPELLLPTPAGWAVHRGLAAGLSAQPATVIALPEPPEKEVEGEHEVGDASAAGDSWERHENRESERTGDPRDEESGGDSAPQEDEDRPVHDLRFQVQDCNGDGRPDFVVPRGAGFDGPLIFRGTGDLGFAAALELRPGGDEAEREVMFVGDLDGDGDGDVVDRTELERFADPGWRQEVDEAKRPLFDYSVRRVSAELAAEPEPHLAFQALGYTFSGADDEDDEEEIRLPGGLQDLDGDGRQDLVAITLEFSVLPMVMRVLVAQRISLTMNFHVWCQTDDSGFAEVPDLDLSGKFKLDLDNIQVRHLSQFAGDFDGDGRADFVQLGRGKRVTIHLGRAACRYPALPDRTIKLSRKLRHLGLARILDLDGDGRSDLYVVHPIETADEDVSIPARVDLYLSRF